MHREPDMGLNPGSPGSRPEPKAGTKLLRHPGIPEMKKFKGIIISTICKLNVDNETHTTFDLPFGREK